MKKLERKKLIENVVDILNKIKSYESPNTEEVVAIESAIHFLYVYSNGKTTGFPTPPVVPVAIKESDITEEGFKDLADNLSKSNEKILKELSVNSSDNKKDFFDRLARTSPDEFNQEK